MHRRFADDFESSFGETCLRFKRKRMTESNELERNDLQ